jgi:DNA-binding beta-propeller fold protein YncE
MRSRKHARPAYLAVEAAEVLELRTLPSATALESLAATGTLSASQASIVSQLAATPNLDVSTVPANGDLNPYGVAIVPVAFAPGGKLHAGDILVSNFNNSTNLQGAGTTIVDIAPDGHQTVFFQGPKGLGLTTALGVLRNGFVLVGSVPTTDGTFSTIKEGSLLILDKNGHIVANLTDKVKLDGPWDLTIFDEGNFAYVFVSNVLNGTVTRLDLGIPPLGNAVHVISSTTIASGYLHRGDPAALAIGPTGLAFDPLHDLLYVASTGNNAIYSISNAAFRSESAGKGKLVFADPHLRGPLGLVLLPDGNLITANGDSINADSTQTSELVEFTPSGKFVGETSIDPGAAGAFGIAAEVTGDDTVFAAVDDNTNTLKVWDFEG